MRILVLGSTGFLGRLLTERLAGERCDVEGWSRRATEDPESGTRRVSRGGSWRHQIPFSRCAARSSISPAFQYADYGLRIACDVDRLKA